jgi:hypothetical protein
LQELESSQSKANENVGTWEKILGQSPQCRTVATSALWQLHQRLSCIAQSQVMSNIIKKLMMLQLLAPWKVDAHAKAAPIAHSLILDKSILHPLVNSTTTAKPGVTPAIIMRDAGDRACTCTHVPMLAAPDAMVPKQSHGLATAENHMVAAAAQSPSLPSLSSLLALSTARWDTVREGMLHSPF